MKNETNNDPKSNQDPALSKKRLLNLIVIAVVFLVVFSLWDNINNSSSGLSALSYSQFKDQVRAGNVSQVSFEGASVEGVFITPIEINGQQTQHFTTRIPPVEDPELVTLLSSQNVEIASVPVRDDSFMSGLLMNLLFIGALVAVWFFMMRRFSGGQQSQLNSFTKGHHKQFKKEMSKTTFADVAGMEGAKIDLEEVVEFLRNPEKFKRLGAKIPKGVLLVGPPGTGKTLVARAVAGEAETPFFSLSGSEFIEMLVGVGAARVRSLFKDAKANSPCVIFIDEIDSIGRIRGTGLGGGHDEREQTLNQLLSEMDGFEGTDDLIVLAATNRPDVLDPALLRPGRFDRKVIIDNPQMNERLEILKIHARNKPFHEDVDFDNIARSTPGLSGADLENILNEAALLAGRHDKKEIDSADIRESLDKVMLGAERRNMLNEEERRPVAYHEAGHAVLGYVLPASDPIHKISIIPRGMSLGHTLQLPEKDTHLYFRNKMLDRLRILLGGRAAEELFLDDISSGAAGDFKSASKLARNMVCLWGMSEEIGNLYIETVEESPFLGRAMATGRGVSEKTAEKVDAEVKRFLQEAETDACRLLKKYGKAVAALVEALLEKETLEGAELAEIMEANGVVALSRTEANGKDK